MLIPKNITINNKMSWILWDLNKSRPTPPGHISKTGTHITFTSSAANIRFGYKQSMFLHHFRSATLTCLSHPLSRLPDLLGLLGGALAHKSKAKQPIRLLLLPHSRASGIHFSTDKEREIALTFTAHVLPQLSRQTAGESHETVLRFLPLLSYPR